MARCEARTRSGEQCKTDALKGQRLCFHHSKAAAKERAEAWQRGGLNRRRPKAEASDQYVKLESPRGVLAFIEQAGECARTLSHLCRLALIAFEAGRDFITAVKEIFAAVKGIFGAIKKAVRRRR